ncbi:MAG: hypothetical protein IEMM0008_0090 [bacterium]|nr:MAG: hypothetical protein IEMM0008_0090 [bacterium]
MINKRLKVILTVCLMGVLMLIFFFQRKYFTEELNSPWLGGWFLVAILFFEFLSHYAFFKSKELFAKVLFGMISFTILAFSMFVNFAVQVHLSEKNQQENIQVRVSAGGLKKARLLNLRILEGQRSRLEKGIRENRLLIRQYRKSSPWLTLRYKKQNEKYRLELLGLDKRILSRSKASSSIVLSYSIIESVGKATGLPASSISLANKGLFAFLLALIPIAITWLLTLSAPAAAPEKDEGDNEDQEEDEEEEDLVPAAQRDSLESQVLVNSFPLAKKKTLLSFNTFVF